MRLGISFKPNAKKKWAPRGGSLPCVRQLCRILAELLSRLPSGQDHKRLCGDFRPDLSKVLGRLATEMLRLQIKQVIIFKLKRRCMIFAVLAG
jgi:hypothetical protein